jgi:hypothetical protein
MGRQIHHLWCFLLLIDDLGLGWSWKLDDLRLGGCSLLDVDFRRSLLLDHNLRLRLLLNMDLRRSLLLNNKLLGALLLEYDLLGLILLNNYIQLASAHKEQIGIFIGVSSMRHAPFL